MTNYLSVCYIYHLTTQAQACGYQMENEEKALVIVESPAKSRTISHFLGKNYRIMATMGHIRDLPPDKFGVDVKNNFEPTYRIMPGKEKVVQALRKEAPKYSTLFLATDEDREGEAIAWHTAHLLKRDPNEIKRVVFHEITSSAVRQAFKSPRTLDPNLVNAQQARRILDRIVGYTLSPILGKRLKKGLSAGRVQSAAMRILVNREKEIQAFTSEKYFLIQAQLAPANQPETGFSAVLSGKDGKNFPKPGIKERTEAEAILAFLQTNSLSVSSVQRETRKEFPFPPFTTSTLQQEAGRRLSLSATRTMSLAQQLYEGVELGPAGATGLITYHRTDSVSIAKSARLEAAKFIKETFGTNYLPDRPPVYKTKNSLAQEAHEAIRPTSVLRTPESLVPYLSELQLKIYRLIWERFVASQMVPGLVDVTKVRIECGPYFFDVEGKILKFDGYRKVSGGTPKDILLPPLAEKEQIIGQKFEINDKETEPPSRYTESTLIKTMEQLGIGRPSTYAPTISTLFSRDYVHQKKRTLFPTTLGIMTNDILVQNFSEVVNLDFTAQMEKELDEIAEGKEAWQKVLSDFYQPFEETVQKAEKNLFNQPVVSEEKCPKCGGRLLLKNGRFGAFLSCERYPECDYGKNLVEKFSRGTRKEPTYAKASVGGPAAEVIVSEKCPKCAGQLIVRKSRYGQFLGCVNYPRCKYTRSYRPSQTLTPGAGSLPSR